MIKFFYPKECVHYFIRQVNVKGGIPVTTREFSFRQELLLEKGAAVIGDCMRYESKMNIKDEKNPVCILHDFVWKAKQNILASTTSEELDKIEGKFILADQMMKTLEQEQ